MNIFFTQRTKGKLAFICIVELIVLNGTWTLRPPSVFRGYDFKCFA